MTGDWIARVGPDTASNAIMSPDNVVTLARMARLAYALSARVEFTLPDPLNLPSCSADDYVITANDDTVPTDSEVP